MKKFLVYKITNLLNGKIYIGKSNSNSDRWKEHLLIAKSKYPRLYFYLHKSINKYGAENFTYETLEYFDDELAAFSAEMKYIALYRSNNPKYGMNLNIGGVGGNTGLILSKEAKKKIGAANSGEKSAVAVFTNEQVKKIRIEFLDLKLFRYKNPHLILAEKYKVSKTTITDIIYGATYKDAKIEYTPSIPKGTKVCIYCHTIKELADFYIDSYSKDGRRAQCIKCFSEIRKNRRKSLKKSKSASMILPKEE